MGIVAMEDTDMLNLLLCNSLVFTTVVLSGTHPTFAVPLRRVRYQGHRNKILFFFNILLIISKLKSEIKIVLLSLP
jgi:hypothetical protein